MILNRCLVCYEQNDVGNYHSKCSRELFGTPTPPLLEISQVEIEEMAREVLNRRITIPGVQRKLSLNIEKQINEPSRLTIVGALGGSHILKPPTEEYPEMPELENLTMHLAKFNGISTAAHGLILMKDQSLAYITKRFDRYGTQKKLAVEDLCQLSELPVENKYKSTSEKAGKVIRKYSSNPGDDLLKFFEILLFSFLVGNSDMHLKNFSLITSQDDNVGMSPAYDLLATQLLLTDHEELALSLGGKKTNIKSETFFELGKNLKIPEKVVKNAISMHGQSKDRLKLEIEKSILSETKKAEFIKLIHERSARLLQF